MLAWNEERESQLGEHIFTSHASQSGWNLIRLLQGFLQQLQRQLRCDGGRRYRSIDEPLKHVRLSECLKFKENIRLRNQLSCE